MSRRAPLVTVLMPCKNAHAGFLNEALDSVFGQSSPRWELVVIDDSTDDPATLAALATLASRGDERVRVIASRARYVTGALNTGMEHAETEYVCVLDCDDLLDPRAVDTLGRFIGDHPHVDYFYSSRQMIDEQGRALSSVYEATAFSSLSEFTHTCPVKALRCWRAFSALAIGGMDESFGLHGGSDYDFSWSMAEAGYTFATIPDCLYYVRDHRAHYRLTTHVPLDVQVQEVERILRKHGLSDSEIEVELDQRKADYLQQALYASQEDKQRKDGGGFDPRSGWRQPHRPAEP